MEEDGEEVDVNCNLAVVALGIGKPNGACKGRGGQQGVLLSIKNKLTISLQVGGRRERGGATVDVDAVGNIFFASIAVDNNHKA